MPVLSRNDMLLALRALRGRLFYYAIRGLHVGSLARTYNKFRLCGELVLGSVAIFIQKMSSVKYAKDQMTVGVGNAAPLFRNKREAQPY